MTHAMTSLMTKGLSLMITSSATNLTLSKDMERVILILKHLINNIQAVNGGAEPPPPLGSLSGLLNISNKAPDYMKFRPRGQMCPGYLRKRGATHHSSIKLNMKCSHKLCLSYCQMGQQVHHLTCNFKAHHYKPASLGDSATTSPVIGGLLTSSKPSGWIQGSWEATNSPPQWIQSNFLQADPVRSSQSNSYFHTNPMTALSI
ncbi:hypothetical protein MJO28_011634 [Puccinia striiformis f. sp. tritici]|uniref:Uncharacterized protein n=1 Tax=Puccinia striiformis f. sp. tritici TaxID=168172 RepID=A0ACC0E427_9BASI|nr:hypothetical protein MJO28_011634 [Puccinia striiformis f. sp. tritici]